MKKILGSCSVTTYKLKNDIEFTNLESIGTDGADAQIKFEIEATNILCPKLKTINGKFDIATSSFMFDMEVDKVSYPNVKYLFENNVLTGESQWSVKECGYNPTFQEMKDGKYKLAE